MAELATDRQSPLIPGQKKGRQNQGVKRDVTTRLCSGGGDNNRRLHRFECEQSQHGGAEPQSRKT